jgi:cephalosporin hydroxylase
VVVVFYDMRREAPRTLHSLSRVYQQGIDHLSYEVIVLENGSPPGGRLEREEVEAHGPEFRFIDLAEAATPSPTTALNRGIAGARGEVVALMIDGAHVLTPGVLRLGVTGMRAYAPAFVSTQQWYVGPGQQSEAQQAGYDQAMEDRLFDGIGWPDDGYRLFEVGDFIGDRDWFDGMFESNCLFVTRDLLDQIGGFDDSFDMGGGGYANLDLYERVAQHPGINAVTLLGEGSFHQFHGGTTTNVAELAQRRRKVAGYGEHFAQLRGRSLVGNMNPMYYLGSLAARGSRRIRARGDLVLNPDPARDPVHTTSTDPTLVPDQLKVAAIGAVWDSQAWRQTTWLGWPLNRYPTDLHIYQELVTRTRPDVVVLVADDNGLAGRALYLATVCDLLGHGRVLAVGPRPVDGIELPAVTWFAGAAEAPEVVAAVRGEVGAGTAMLLIGLGPNHRVAAVFDAYHDLVPVDGYAVVENTLLNGRPVAAEFGAGPLEATVGILGRHPDFLADVSCERYTLTFNRGGYLRRL